MFTQKDCLLICNCLPDDVISDTPPGEDNNDFQYTCPKCGKEYLIWQDPLKTKPFAILQNLLDTAKCICDRRT